MSVTYYVALPFVKAEGGSAATGRGRRSSDVADGGDPLARAEETEVLETFARYAPWGGLAAAYAMRLSGPALPAPAGIRL